MSVRGKYLAKTDNSSLLAGKNKFKQWTLKVKTPAMSLTIKRWHLLVNTQCLRGIRSVVEQSRNLCNENRQCISSSLCSPFVSQCTTKELRLNFTLKYSIFCFHFFWGSSCNFHRDIPHLPQCRPGHLFYTNTWQTGSPFCNCTSPRVEDRLEQLQHHYTLETWGPALFSQPHSVRSMSRVS